MKGSYVQDFKEDDPEAPLLWALRFIVQSDKPVRNYIFGMFPPKTGVGGDPGWWIDRETGEDGSDYYHVSVDPEMSGLTINEGDYTVETVKRRLRSVLDTFVRNHPERADEVCAVIKEFAL